MYAYGLLLVLHLLGVRNMLYDELYRNYIQNDLYVNARIWNYKIF